MHDVNLSEREASLSVLAGSVVFLSSLTHRGLGRLLRLGTAAWLVQRGVTRSCPLYATLGIDRSERVGEQHRVDTTLEESFPASDSPSFTPERD